MQKEIKKNPKKNPNHLICIRNAKKETKKDPIHLYLICIRNAKKKLNLICIKK